MSLFSPNMFVLLHYIMYVTNKFPCVCVRVVRLRMKYDSGLPKRKSELLLHFISVIEYSFWLLRVGKYLRVKYI